VRVHILMTLATLVVTPALPNPIDAIMDSSVSASGDLECDSSDQANCTPSGLGNFPFGLSGGGMNTELGVFSGSSSTFASSRYSLANVNATAGAEQTAAANTDSFSLDLRSTASASGFGAKKSSTPVIPNGKILTFSATKESIMQPSADNTACCFGLFGSPMGALGVLYDAAGNLRLALPDSTNDFDDSMTLADNEFIEGPFFSPTPQILSSESNASAQFTPVPESQWLWITPLLLIALGCGLRRLRRVRCAT
jgi:hypothetical protein